MAGVPAGSGSGARAGGNSSSEKSVPVEGSGFGLFKLSPPRSSWRAAHPACQGPAMEKGRTTVRPRFHLDTGAEAPVHRRHITPP